MADHWRTSRQTVGGNQSGGSPHGSKYALPENSILTPSSTLERRKISEPSFDERELGAGFLFFAMVVAPLLFVGLIVLCNRTLG